MLCGKKAIYSKNDISYCSVHSKQIYKSFTNNNKLKNIKVKDSRLLNFDDIKIRLIKELESRSTLLAAHAVVIENQPSIKNPRMKSIASTLYDYYLIRGVFDKTRTGSNINMVKFMSPSNKLKLASEGDTLNLIKVKATDESKSYKLTKALGIKYCQEMIQHLPKWIEFLKNVKKKDDLADAFLQGVYFITTNNIHEQLVLSFDVGVIHLAYCLLTRKNINGKLSLDILEWGNIDLTDREEHKCQCGKKASISYDNNNYCKVHAKKVQINNSSFEEMFIKLKDSNSCCYTVKNKVITI